MKFSPYERSTEFFGFHHNIEKGRQFVVSFSTLIKPYSSEFSFPLSREARKPWRFLKFRLEKEDDSLYRFRLLINPICLNSVSPLARSAETLRFPKINREGIRFFVPFSTRLNEVFPFRAKRGIFGVSSQYRERKTIRRTVFDSY